MGMSDSEKLSIAEIAFYGAALPLAAWIAFRHGFGRQQGWLYIVLLAICRLLGAACAIAANNNPSNTTLITIASICGSIGISFLTQAMIGLIKRVHDGMEPGKGVPPRYLNILSLPLLIGIILGIVGGVDESSTTDAAKVASGQTLFKAAVILFAVVIFIFGAVLLLTALKRAHIAHGERMLVYAVLAAYPLLVVRLLYALIAVCNPSSTTFNIFHPDIIVEAFMATLEEFLIVIILLLAGFMTPTIARAAVQQQQRQQQLLAPEVDGKTWQPAPAAATSEAYHSPAAFNAAQPAWHQGAQQAGTTQPAAGMPAPQYSSRSYDAGV